MNVWLLENLAVSSQFRKIQTAETGAAFRSGQDVTSNHCMCAVEMCSDAGGT